MPAADMPGDARTAFLKARAVFERSPQSPAALLWLSLQKLMPYLGKSHENLNEAIKSLGREGLNPKVQKALDTIRVVGNNAVHPGEITFGDTKETAAALFDLLN